MKANRLLLPLVVTLVYFSSHICIAIDFRAMTLSKGLKTTANANGGLLTYSWDLNATASCTHAPGSPFTNNTEQTDAGDWDVKSVDFPLYATALYGMNAEHPTAGYAAAVFTASSTWSPANNRYDIFGWIDATVGVYASAKADAAVPKDVAATTADVKNVKMSFGKKTISVHDLHGEAKVTSQGKAGKQVNKGTVKKGKKWADPISLTLIEVDTGQTYSQDLYAVNVDVAEFGHAAFTYDNDTGGEGVFLSCDADESVRIDGSSNSDWLISPYGAFSASLSEGSFAATGAWASLPWQLTYEDAGNIASNVLSASLPSEYLLADLEWQIPESLMRDGHSYDLRLDWSESASDSAMAIDEIPEPGPFCLIAGGGLGLLGRSVIRRRKAARI